MNWADFVIIAVVLLILSLAAFAVYRSKKQGKACIGCPDAKKCGQHCCCSQTGDHH